MEDEKKSAALPETEQLIKCLDEHIRKIVHEECGRILWRDLKSRYPELVKALRAEFPCLVPDLPELQTHTDSQPEISQSP